ncbi:MAG: helix-turn-helix domain-containing protein, partial [Acidobacteria bacterium]|nr:helix-turn-helix domain-containing protein [Acidobacteriota bacterium]
MARSATLPYALVQRARMILASAEGLANSAVARRFGVTPQTVGKWRRRFRAAGIEGLHDELRPGRPRTYDDDKVAAVINRALQEKPDPATHWSTRTLGRAEGIAKSTVQRWLALFGVKPQTAVRRVVGCQDSAQQLVEGMQHLFGEPLAHLVLEP